MDLQNINVVSRRLDGYVFIRSSDQNKESEVAAQIIRSGQIRVSDGYLGESLHSICCIRLIKDPYFGKFLNIGCEGPISNVNEKVELLLSILYSPTEGALVSQKGASTILTLGVLGTAIELHKRAERLLDNDGRGIPDPSIGVRYISPGDYEDLEGELSRLRLLESKNKDTIKSLESRIDELIAENSDIRRRILMKKASDEERAEIREELIAEIEKKSSIPRKILFGQTAPKDPGLEVD